MNAIDWRVKENSTVTYSVGGLILSNSGAVTANYWLSEVYDEEIGSAHKNGDMHIALVNINELLELLLKLTGPTLSSPLYSDLHGAQNPSSMQSSTITGRFFPFVFVFMLKCPFWLCCRGCRVYE